MTFYDTRFQGTGESSFRVLLKEHITDTAGAALGSQEAGDASTKKDQ